MDGIRFDNWTRKLSRRKAVAAMGATGVAAAMTKVLPANAQNGGVTCQMSIQALTSAGPSFGTAYAGVLEITLADDGAIDSGSLSFTGGPTVDVVGKVIGRALSMRATFPNGNALVLTGVGENDIETCSGALSGVFGGPELGDTGSWLVDPAASELISSGTGGSDSNIVTPVATATTTPECPGVQCDSTYVVDPATCECVCPASYEACGPVCCPAGSICLDEASGECACPAGWELCGDACVESCPVGEYLDYDTCQCAEGCEITSCPEGEELDTQECVCRGICSGATQYYCGGNCYAENRYECSGICYTAVELNSNAQMCGPSCQVCPSGVPCIAGSCQCPATYSYCQGVGCKSLSDDDENCGSCGTVCSGGKTCQGGMCQL
jgi:hypothetical protein